MTSENIKSNFPKSVLVAISDKNINKDICRIIKDDFKVEATSVIDGQAAWNALKAEVFETVILGWKLEKVTGVAIFNRLRQTAKYNEVPIMVVSNLQQKENFILVKDYHLTAISDGAFLASAFAIKIGLLVQEAVWYRDNSVKLDAIIKQFGSDATKAQTALNNLVKLLSNAIPILILAARKCRDLKYFTAAENILNDARKLGDSASAIMELAKLYHLTSRSSKAMELMSGQKFSIKNVEKLLLEGEINLTEKKPEEARQLFSAVLSLDAENEVAKNGMLVADNLAAFAKQESSDPVPPSFASLLNLVGINMVKAGNPEEGIKHYHAALAFVHDDIAQAKLFYNLGLAYLKHSKKDEALKSFQDSLKFGGDRFDKAKGQIKILTQPEDEKSETRKAS